MAKSKKGPSSTALLNAINHADFKEFKVNLKLFKPDVISSIYQGNKPILHLACEKYLQDHNNQDRKRIVKALLEKSTSSIIDVNDAENNTTLTFLAAKIADTENNEPLIKLIYYLFNKHGATYKEKQNTDVSAAIALMPENFKAKVLARIKNKPVKSWLSELRCEDQPATETIASQDEKAEAKTSDKPDHSQKAESPEQDNRQTSEARHSTPLRQVIPLSARNGKTPPNPYVNTTLSAESSANQLRLNDTSRKNSQSHDLQPVNLEDEKESEEITSVNKEHAYPELVAAISASNPGKFKAAIAKIITDNPALSRDGKLTLSEDNLLWAALKKYGKSPDQQSKQILAFFYESFRIPNVEEKISNDEIILSSKFDCEKIAQWFYIQQQKFIKMQALNSDDEGETELARPQDLQQIQAGLTARYGVIPIIAVKIINTFRQKDDGNQAKITVDSLIQYMASKNIINAEDYPAKNKATLANALQTLRVSKNDQLTVPLANHPLLQPLFPFLRIFTADQFIAFLQHSAIILSDKDEQDWRAFLTGIVQAPARVQAQAHHNQISQPPSVNEQSAPDEKMTGENKSDKQESIIIEDKLLSCRPALVIGGATSIAATLTGITLIAGAFTFITTLTTMTTLGIGLGVLALGLAGIYTAHRYSFFKCAPSYNNYKLLTPDNNENEISCTQ